MARVIQQTLIIEDNLALLHTLKTALSQRGWEIWSAQTIQQASEVLAEKTPDLVLLDVSLPDGDAFDILALLKPIVPAPIVLAMSGTASPDQSFSLSRRGVRAYLSKPISLEKLDKALEEAINNPPDLRAHIQGSVGFRGVHEVEKEVRATMVTEALEHSKGSKRKAAKLLRVSRQLIQHILRGRDDS